MAYYKIENNEMVKVELTSDYMETEVFPVIDRATKQPMSEELTRTMVELMFANKNLSIPEAKKPFELKVVESRLKGLTMKIEDTRLLLFLCVIEGSVGTAVFYLLYLQYWCKKHNVRELSLETFAERVFPWGFPSTEDLHTAYDKQKLIEEDENGRRHSTNVMDMQLAYMSIQFD